MGQTRTEKNLAKALKALKYIADCNLPNVGDDEQYAAKVYAELTEPQMEEVEVKRWIVVYEDGTFASHMYDTEETARQNSRGMVGGSKADIKEITIPIRRPITEPEEKVWEGRVVKDDSDCGVIYLPKEWIGKIVEVRLKGE